MKPYDVQVRGTGLVGHALALSLARIGLRVALAGEPVSVRAETEALLSARIVKRVASAPGPDRKSVV